ncbi:MULTISPECIES: NifB/NifX family molybdenum-iron cluster-binding protein [unclassified Butyrivibrio]|uniref:NifB/NifX family molybdenum-iron cluster-binding protein n=1 Tax=unclassified Butyrivibrio TaxID=2639466 RepID=UPI000405F18B|nr:MULTISPECIES: NifB/NifX family molybdenum-iron cluster-binding protein [unclassified Butyrivibrio]
MKNASYRVALASTDNRYVDQHFGRAESFLIVDVDEDGNFEEIEQRFVSPVCNGGSHDSQKLKRGVEALLDCNFVLAAKIGAGAAYELKEHGIASFEMPGEVENSIFRLDGYIKLLNEMNGVFA